MYLICGLNVSKMSRKIIVGVDTRDLHIAKTGARTYLEELCKEFGFERNDCHFVYFDTDFPVYTGRNKFFKLIEQFRFILWKQVVLPLKAWSKKCDILFCTDYFVPYVHLGYKTVPVLHDAFFWEYPEHYNRYWLMVFKYLGVTAAKRSAVIIAPTEYAKNRILEFMQVEPDKIMAIPEAPKSLPQYPDKESASSPKFILHIGTFEKRKNLVRLIEAFSMLRAQGFTDYVLVLGGQSSPKTDMDDTPNILHAIKQYNVSEYVKMPGYIADKDLSYYYKNAEMYVFPSVNEGFGLPILEAFQHDLPVLIADNTCLPEVGGDAVLMFDPYDVEDLTNKMSQLISDHELRSSLIDRGKERLKNYSWINTAQQLTEVFKDLVK
jgi:glycosyltransferase involved in cell wall biosynthesis